MKASLLSLGGFVVFSVAVARALSCVCSPFECDVLTDEDCPGGLTWDPCRCCKVCARVEGEPCGGLFGFSGSCADGLQCVIKNLLPNTREVDEGICTKIPGRWRRHCPHGPTMSKPGCNLVSDGTKGQNGNTVSTGRCVCGASVPWCSDEPQPYEFATRHECELNLAAKMNYDDLFNSGNAANDDVEGDARAAECPEDSVRDENGNCKCAANCPVFECSTLGQRPVQVKSAEPETPGSCCARYDCAPLDSREPGPCPENRVLTEDGKCECAPCPPANCQQPGYWPVQVRAALDRETPGNCCPLYECKPAESLPWVKVSSEVPKLAGYCIYEEKTRKLGERWQQSDCVTCICEEDGVSCQEPMCKSCENAIPPDPGECCPHCPPLNNPTLLDPEACQPLRNCGLTCEQHGYEKDENNCLVCSCVKAKDEIEEQSVTKVSDVEDDCLEPPDCDSNCVLAKDERGCSVCSCQSPENFEPTVNETVMIDETGKKICPQVKCDLHCERGLVMDENDCTFCECRPPESGCPLLMGCRKRCTFGYKLNKRGCPMCRCRASCTDRSNGTHPEGATWRPNSCTSCTCEAGGKLSCRETVCSVACKDALPPKPGTCCPICPITSTKGNGTVGHSGSKGWGTIPITLIAILALLCLLLIVHIVRGRFRARLSPSDVSYSSYPPLYYKCVPAYDTPTHRNEKIVPL